MSTEAKDEKIRSAQRIRIPVRYVDGHWELAYGGAIKVKNGTAAELIVGRGQIADAEFLRALTAKRWVRILEEGTELRAALTIHGELAPSLKAALARNTQVKQEEMRKLSADSRFVPVFLGPARKAQTKRKELKGGLWLALEGAEPRALESSEVRLPEGLQLKPAISVNHAFTVLSEVFESSRLSHTGNIYQRVFYKEGDGYWYPLDDLRKMQSAASERAIVKALWGKVEQLLRNPL